ncbi:unnamed protein product [Nesidiocoris tenuis]|uniref:Uncharacterized protein n=1 Tax=Nesidiocoris tenuis TaxID=355587 RepID=A0A6H5HK68_9HEMI|nr:unnamed protein product [Nesidiocoris tenuis]
MKAGGHLDTGRPGVNRFCGTPHRQCYLRDVSNWFLTPSVIGACMSVIGHDEGIVRRMFSNGTCFTCMAHLGNSFCTTSIIDRSNHVS